MQTKEKGRWEIRKKGLAGAFFVLLSLAAVAVFSLHSEGSRGVRDYRIIHEQVYEEYTERYEYSDVLTLGYVRLEGLSQKVQDGINEKIYSSIFGRADYWHYEPDEEVKAFQESYTIYSDDVVCTPELHSQYLLSLNFTELYAPDNPAFWMKHTRWGMTFDLITGEEYRLQDILITDERFSKLWMDKAVSGKGDDKRYIATIQEWFTGEITNEEYEIVPFYFVTQDKELFIGLALNPTLEGLYQGAPEDNTLGESFTYEELEAFVTDSPFWERYHQSKPAGEIVENEEHAENLWLGEEGAVWDYWESR